MSEAIREPRVEGFPAPSSVRAPVAMLIAALVVALCARAPGIFWGNDFPGGFRSHHVDETTHVVLARKLIRPGTRPLWDPPYPTGLAAHVAVPFVVQRAASGRLFDEEPPSTRTLVLAGRAVSAVYGVLTVWVLWLLARRLFPAVPAIAVLVAWMGALGGLHVSQSHFFVADVPALFWSLLAGYLLLADREESGERIWKLSGAALAVGAAIGLKLAIHMLAPLAVVALMGRHRGVRSAVALAFSIAGFAVVTAFTFTSIDVARCFTGSSVMPPDRLDWRDFPRLYGIELLASVGIPVVALAFAGLVLAVRALPRCSRRRAVDVGVTLVFPLLVYATAVLPRIAPFPRHLLPLFPALFVLAAMAVAAIRATALRRAVAVGTILWSAALVADTERVYLHEPRTAAMEWLDANAPKGGSAWWPAYQRELEARGLVVEDFAAGGAPDVVVAEAYRVNHSLSGTGLRDSRPEDHRAAFTGGNAAEVGAWQALFDGETALREVARFSEGYWMPEPRLADRLLGNRSRNYLSEVVIFARR